MNTSLRIEIFVLGDSSQARGQIPEETPAAQKKMPPDDDTDRDGVVKIWRPRQLLLEEGDYSLR